jgi:hypothetical protein
MQSSRARLTDSRERGKHDRARMQEAAVGGTGRERRRGAGRQGRGEPVGPPWRAGISRIAQRVGLSAFERYIALVHFLG